jgi:dynein heavy chain 1
MNQILEKRSVAMDRQLPTLQAKIREEDSLLHSRTDELSASWEKSRPSESSAAPSDVLQILSMFATQVAKLVEDANRLQGAKSALGLEFVTDNRLSYITQEVSDLREAWNAVTPFHERLNKIREQLMKDCNAISIRKQLEEISGEVRNLPAKVRSYAAIEFLQDKIAKCLTMQPVLRDLNTEALKDRHWRLILHGLGITRTLSELTIGAIWDANPLPQRKLIQDVLSTAQGELALEQFLRDLREYWLGCELSLVVRDNIRLVTGWEQLFTTLEDNLNSLASLKQSPYFRNVPEFQEDTANWEGRLTSLRAIFDFWVEVQRKVNRIITVLLYTI